MNKKLRSRPRATGNYTTIKQPKVTFRVDNESIQTRNKITEVRTPLQSPLKGISALLKKKARIRMDRTVNSLHICAYGTYKAHPRNESPDTDGPHRKLHSKMCMGCNNNRKLLRSRPRARERTKKRRCCGIPWKPGYGWTAPQTPWTNCNIDNTTQMRTPLGVLDMAKARTKAAMSVGYFINQYR